MQCQQSDNSCENSGVGAVWTFFQHHNCRPITVKSIDLLIHASDKLTFKNNESFISLLASYPKLDPQIMWQLYLSINSCRRRHSTTIFQHHLRHPHSHSPLILRQIRQTRHLNRALLPDCWYLFLLTVFLQSNTMQIFHHFLQFNPVI